MADIDELVIDDLLPAGEAPLGAGPVSLDADIAIPSLPTPFQLCGAFPGRDLADPPIDPALTGPCEQADPFGDGSAETGPFALVFDAPSTFDVLADLELTGDVLFGQGADLPLGFGPFTRLAADLEVRGVPDSITALIGLPVAAPTTDGLERSAARVHFDAPAASDLQIDLRAALEGDLTDDPTDGRADCGDPTSPGTMVCADVHVDGLPAQVDVVADILTDPAEDDAVVDLATRASTCGLDLSAGDPTCSPGTDGTVTDRIEADLRIQTGDRETDSGDPDHVPLYVPPAEGPQAFLLADVDSLAEGSEDFEVRAGFRLTDVRDAVLSQRATGLDAEVALGNGAAPMVIHGFADIVGARGLPDGVPSGRGEADLVVAPLPPRLDLDADWGPDLSTPLRVEVDTTPTGASTGPAIDLTGGFDVGLAGPDGAVPGCGGPGTLCGDLAVTAIPGHGAAQITRTVTPEGGGDVQQVGYEAHVDLASGAGAPTVDADVTLGLPTSLVAALPDDIPDDLLALATRPLRLQAEITGLPRHATIGLATTERLRREGGDLVAVDRSVDRVRAYACNRDLATDQCVDGGGPLGAGGGALGAIGRAEVRAATFLVRPAGFPPVHSAADQALLVGGRGADLEAVARMSGFQLLDLLPTPGAAGARVQLLPGSDHDRLDVEVDVAGLAIGDLLALPATPITRARDLEDPTVDLRLSASLAPFPDEVSFCLTEPVSRQPEPAGTNGLLDPCRTHPFGDEVDAEEVFGAGVVLGGATDPTFELAADVALHGTDAETGDPAPTHRLFVDTTVHQVPSAASVPPPAATDRLRRGDDQRRGRRRRTPGARPPSGRAAAGQPRRRRRRRPAPRPSSCRRACSSASTPPATTPAHRRGHLPRHRRDGPAHGLPARLRPRQPRRRRQQPACHRRRCRPRHRCHPARPVRCRARCPDA